MVSVKNFSKPIKAVSYNHYEKPTSYSSLIVLTIGSFCRIGKNTEFISEFLKAIERPESIEKISLQYILCNFFRKICK